MTRYDYSLIIYKLCRNSKGERAHRVWDLIGPILLKKLKEIDRQDVTSPLSCNYTGDVFTSDFLIKMDVIKLHIFNNGSHCDKSYLSAENECLKLFPF